ncbi:MAG: hypothetical protein JRJ85_17635 [Deltaproteobacteria bacterium]|nr:hypothetical protein [Deltaproteobacteria bacterium]
MFELLTLFAIGYLVHRITDNLSSNYRSGNDQTGTGPSNTQQRKTADDEEEVNEYGEIKRG